ncbi:hypothetical protein PSECIP111854_00411 [Pseudoalteromonas sp. CIP111854]|uniref:Uncharacterized protein n=1 Tax=Pseudoalteromonas holothuriae TaxID=2963714 RepID=A0A9W4VV57_9GAMM|nr:hypothetical protein [Pseudoalteromonas sp. CIP111854]CAH9049919.1 hypothetical protein PSECIP111854_00411 [Pseudoalteromonas sp. CIP111854]
MKKTSIALILSTLAFSAGASASNLGVSITEKPRPGVPQARWTDVVIGDQYSQNQNANFSYNVTNYNVSFSWVTNDGAQGGCQINYDVNRDSSTDFTYQIAKRRYNNTIQILTNLKSGDHLFIQSGFNSNTAPCEVTLKHKIGF